MTTHQDTSTEREKLKPCPFCGGNARVTFVSDHRISHPRTGRRVACDDCLAQTGAFDFEGEAVASWNNRAALASSREAAPSDFPPEKVPAQQPRGKAEIDVYKDKEGDAYISLGLGDLNFQVAVSQEGRVAWAFKHGDDEQHESEQI